MADDKDGDKLFFSITDGDDAKDFYINPDQGNLVVASKLNFSRKKLYNLTIEITDGRQQTHANVNIDILPMVTKRPQFKQQITQVRNYNIVYHSSITFVNFWLQRQPIEPFCKSFCVTV